MDIDATGAYLETLGLTDHQIDVYFEHHGVKGQKWGVRRKIRKEHFGEVKRIKAGHRATERKAKKDPDFRREVRRTRKARGISGITGAEKSSQGLLTGRVMGDFKNSKGEKVSEDFANAVLSKAVSKNQRRKTASIGALFVAAYFGGKAIGSAR